MGEYRSLSPGTFPPFTPLGAGRGRLGRTKHIIHGLIEVDVTAAWDYLRANEEQTGERLSFTAIIAVCLARAIKSHDHLRAYLNWRRQLVIYETVNINIMVEVERHGRKYPMTHILKAVDKRSLLQVHDEIRSVQAQPHQSREARFMNCFLALPWLFHCPFYWVVTRVPQWFREYSTPVLVTAVGMFGRGGGWGIPMANFTLTVTIGGISPKPWVVDGRIEPREIMDMTLSIDHDIVDGAPAARFVQEFRRLIEEGYGLSEIGAG